MARDFTLETYAQMCEDIRSLDCPTMTMRDFLAAGQPPGPAVILRHDVDRGLGAALRMARVESTLNIAATYYVRPTRALAKPLALTRLHELHHEVGYHCEVLARARGNLDGARSLLEDELAALRRIVHVETVSMHGSPLSRWPNLDLWRTIDPGDHGLLGVASLSIDYRGAYYFTDTGRSWCAGACNLRDRVKALEPPKPVCSTQDLVAFLTTRPQVPVFINAHPGRWAASGGAWLAGAFVDGLANCAKWALSRVRRSLCGRGA